MADLICPVCGSALVRAENRLVCVKNHSFDVARYGYVNLLMSNKSSAGHHGDDKLMINARRCFLDRGYYEPLRTAVTKAVLRCAKPGVHIVDSGCGDGWYTAYVYNTLLHTGLNPTVIGIDISKEALIAAGRRNRKLTLCVASAARLPVKSESADIIMNIFSPFEFNEFSRVLVSNGYLIRAVPMEKHLWSLKQAVYDFPYENPPADTRLSGFSLCDKIEVREKFVLNSNEDIQNLFKMTPYYYKTGIKDQQKLDKLSSLKTEIEVMVLIYKKDI